MRNLRNLLRNFAFKLYFSFSRVMLRFLNRRGTSWFAYVFNTIIWHDPTKILKKASEAYEINLYAKILSSLLERPIADPGILNNQQLEKILIQKMERDIYQSTDESKRLVEDYSIRLEPEFLAELQQVDIKSKLSVSNQEVTVVYPFRDRDVERLELSVKSLLKSNSVPIEIIVVDYGSKHEFRDELKDFGASTGIKIIRTETEGYPWSRAQVLNLGIKAAKTKFVVTTDIDMLFEDDIVGKSIERYSENSKIHCKPLWLKKDGIRANAWLGDHFQLGGYMFTEKKLLEEAGLFDNSIFYWGIEDIELNTRLNRKNIQTIWIEDESRMYHMWHTPSYGDFDMRPLSSWFDSNLLLMHTILDKTAEASHMKVEIVPEAQRPILKMIDETTAAMFEVHNYMNQLKEISEYKTENKFTKLTFGPRIVDPTSISIKQNLAYLDKFFKGVGAEIGVLKNKNFDFFYLSLPLLKADGLIDYYITEDYSAAYLLFK